MLVDHETLATLKSAADEMCKLKVKAEDSVKLTNEAKLVETLTKKWLRLNGAYDAAKKLLEFESESAAAVENPGAAA